MAESGVNGWSDSDATVIGDVNIADGFGAMWLVAANHPDGRAVSGQVIVSWSGETNLDFATLMTAGGLGIVFGATRDAAKAYLAVISDDPAWVVRSRPFII